MKYISSATITTFLFLSMVLYSQDIPIVPASSAPQEGNSHPLPLLNNRGYTVGLGSIAAIFLTGETGYEALPQGYSGLALKNSFGRTFGIYQQITVGKLSPSTFSDSLYRYRGFDTLIVSIGPFLDLSMITKIPFDIQVSVGGGGALGYYRESAAVFFFPVCEPAITMHMGSLKRYLVFSGTLSLPLLFQAQTVSVGMGIQFTMAFVPFIGQGAKEGAK